MNKHDENTERSHRLHNSRAAIIGLISHRHLSLKLRIKARFIRMLYHCRCKIQTRRKYKPVLMN